MARSKTFLEVTRELINKSTESFDSIAYAVQCNHVTLRNIASGKTVHADCDLVQRIYEYLTDCELEF